MMRNNKEQSERNPEDCWLDIVLGKKTPKGDMNTKYWKDLQKLEETALAEKQFILKEDIDGYEIDDKEGTCINII